jgi:hypothetical protein
MADTKISALTAVTTPVAGTSVLPIVQTGTTKKITITELTGTQVSAAGEVGIGGDTTGVVAGVSVTSKFCVKNEGANPVAGFVHVNDTTANSGSNTFACRSRGTLAVPTIVQNNDSLWNMYIAGNDGTDLALAAEIRVEVDGTPGSNDMPGRILLRTTPDGSQAPVDAVKIDSAQNVTVSAGNLVIGTSGKGIDFSATSGTGTSELLADYEEGIWTPAFTFATPGDVAITYGVQVGTYTKVGRMITVAFRLTTSAFTWTTASGALQITGIPFASRTLTNMRWHNPCSFNGITKLLYTQFQLQLNSASSTIVANMSASGQSQSGVSAADLPSGGTPFFSGILTYETD